jgi:uncharacterized protein
MQSNELATSTPLALTPEAASNIPRPWYREPWPWLLIAPPAIAVAGGIVMAWLAFSSADGVVADDYYRRGLAINRDLGRERVALERGITAAVARSADALRVELSGDAPEFLFVRLAHSVRAEHDLRLRLARTAGGVYEAPLEALPRGHWRVVIEDPLGQWRIVKERL